MQILILHRINIPFTTRAVLETTRAFSVRSPRCVDRNFKKVKTSCQEICYFNTGLQTMPRLHNPILRLNLTETKTTIATSELLIPSSVCDGSGDENAKDTHQVETSTEQKTSTPGNGYGSSFQGSTVTVDPLSHSVDTQSGEAVMTCDTGADTSCFTSIRLAIMYAYPDGFRAFRIGVPPHAQ